MERRKFVKIMAASSAMMAANPFALVSPRPPIFEGGTYRVTWMDGHDEWNWMGDNDHLGFTSHDVPGLERIGNTFGIPFTDPTERCGWTDDPNEECNWEWNCQDYILKDKAAFRHYLVQFMDYTIKEFEGYGPWLGHTPSKLPRLGCSDDVYYDTFPHEFRHLMIGCGLINDRRLFDWFMNHPEIVNQYPIGEHDDLPRKKYYNWDHLWIDNKMWGPASIKRI
jgi:hypothetical protein